MFICICIFQIYLGKAEQNGKLEIVEFNKGLPAIGSWVYKANGDPTLWLGKKYEGKYLYEPINIIIVDTYSRSNDQSIKRIENICSAINYKKHRGHSSGYYGKINGKLFGQIPKEYRTAFSDGPTWKTSNHCRLYGPILWDEKYIYIGSISRESFTLIAFIHHNFISYNEARDDFVMKMAKYGFCNKIENIQLGNTMNNEEYTTGDHDGNASLIMLN